MKRLILCLMFLFMTGCASTKYYTDPSSGGYDKPIFKGLCESCNRAFSFSQKDFDTYENTGCPFCGKEQNIKRAHNRYSYEVGQQQAYARQQAFQAGANTLADIEIQNAEREKERSSQVWDYLKSKKQQSGYVSGTVRKTGKDTYSYEEYRY